MDECEKQLSADTLRALHECCMGACDQIASKAVHSVGLGTVPERQRYQSVAVKISLVAARRPANGTRSCLYALQCNVMPLVLGN